jgi:hypothetical protein
VYEGDFFDGKFHGKGKRKAANGDTYEGDFIANKAHGKGKITFKSGSTITGDFIGGQPHGKCKKKVANGDTYEGGYIGGLEHGKGKQHSAKSGDVEGDFIGGQVHGKGKSKAPGGETYEGDFYKGRFHGEGRYVDAYGNVQQGIFVNARYEGPSSTGSSSSGSSYADDKGNIVLALIAGFIGAGCASSLGAMLSFVPLLGKLLPLALAVVGFIICFKIWRNNNGARIFKIAGFCIACLVIGNFGSKAVGSIKGKTTGQTATVTSDVNFRKGPSTGNDIIRQLQQGDTVTLTGETSGGWTQVSHNGDTGWVSSEFLTTTGAAANAAPQAKENSQSAQGSQQMAAPAQPVKQGIYTIRPRIRGAASGDRSPMDLWLDRIEVQGQTLKIFLTGAPEGKGGDGQYHPFWSYMDCIKLEDKDRPGQSFTAISADEDDDDSNPRSTNGFYNMFQDVKGTRFRLVSYDRANFQPTNTPMYFFDEIIIGEPDR